jgi:hypothetical protein
MKTTKLELNVDFIGGQTSLTVAEEKALSDFFKQRKDSSRKSKSGQRIKTVKREKSFT